MIKYDLLFLVIIKLIISFKSCLNSNLVVGKIILECILMVGWEKCWTAKLKYTNLNASGTITLYFRLVPLGKAWTLLFPLLWVKIFPLLWVKIVSLLFFYKNRFTIKYPYKFECQFHYYILFQTNTLGKGMNTFIPFL